VIVINSNPSTTSPSCTLQFHGLSIGGQTSVPFTISGAHISYSYITPGNMQALQTGYASLQCSSNVEAQLLYAYYTSAGTKVSEATVFSSPSATSLRIFADERADTAGERLQLALAFANDSNQTANYTIYVYDSGGNLIGSPSLTVNAYQNHPVYLDQLLIAAGITVPRNYYGTVDIIASSGTASVIGVGYTGDYLFTTIPAAIMSSTSATASTYHVFPQIADGSLSDGSYLQSTVIVTNSNPSTTSPNCTLQFHGLSIGGQTSVPFTISGAHISYSYTTPGNMQALQTGYASLQCSSNVEAQLLYAYYSSAGTKVSEATVFSSPSATSLRIFADERADTAGERLQLALAFANDSNQTANYTINVYDSSGNLIGSPSLTVNAGQNDPVYLDQLLTGAGITVPRNYYGTVDIIANSGTASIIGVSYTGDYLFTTIPAVILP
jgi:hypothetical protein